MVFVDKVWCSLRRAVERFACSLWGQGTMEVGGAGPDQEWGPVMSIPGNLSRAGVGQLPPLP